MDRNREVRRSTAAATTTTMNGLSRRRQRSNGFRDSPERDAAVELQETARHRDRSSKNVRDPERDKEDRDREKLSRSKRRRGDRVLHESNREERGDESSEESVDYDEGEGDETVRFSPLANHLSQPSSAITNLHRKSFPQKIVRQAASWKATDEMIGVSVPRKARSASMKRSYDGGTIAGPILRHALTSPAASTAPIASSSSNASARKKMKPHGAKNRPPKICKTSSSSSIQEIEIEVAEVLYGLTRQFQSPSKQETIISRDTNSLNNDATSRGSSPIPSSPTPEGSMPSDLQHNSSSVTTPSLAAAAPKWKGSNEDEKTVIFASPNASNGDASSTKPEKNDASANGIGAESLDSGISPIAVQPVVLKDSKPGNNPRLDLKPVKEESGEPPRLETREEAVTRELASAKLDVVLDNTVTTKTQPSLSAMENGETFQIDLMASPLVRPSPERDTMPGNTTDEKPLVPEIEKEPKVDIVKAEKAMERVDESEDVPLEEKNSDKMVEELNSEKLTGKERFLKLQVEIRKQDEDVCGGSSREQSLKPQDTTTKIEPRVEKSAQFASLPLPMAVGAWPGGLPPLRYLSQVPSLQPGVPVDGHMASLKPFQPPHLVQPHPQTKRCVTHFYIAQNIYYHQQFARMNPFWPATVGSAPLYGTRPYNLNVMPPKESAILGSQLHGRNFSSSLGEKGPQSAFPGQGLNEKGLAATTFKDATQKKQQLILQQGPQPGSSNSVLAPTFTFPMNQQQAVIAATGSIPMKSTSTIGNAPPTNPVQGAATASVSSAPTSLSFSYTNMPPNEARYLALLQNSGYPFPLPTHMRASPPYRGGSHPQPVPFFNGTFYSSQMLHHSQLQQQHQGNPQAQPAQVPSLGHQNMSPTSGSTYSQKHQQQQLQGCSNNNGGSLSSQNIPTAKQWGPLQHFPRQNTCQFEVEFGREGSPSTGDSRVSHAPKNGSGLSNHNFALPMAPQNFASMSPAAAGENNTQKQPSQHHNGEGSGMDLFTSQAFATSFTSPGMDFSSMHPNHPIFQRLPEAARKCYLMAAASARPVEQQKGPNMINVEGKSSASDSINQKPSADEERKKASTAISHTLAFSKSDGGDPSTSTIATVAIECSSRTSNLIQANGMCDTRTSSGPTPPTINSAASTTINDARKFEHQQQQMLQVQKHQQQQQDEKQQAHCEGTSGTKSVANANADILECLPALPKYQNSISFFPQAFVHGNSPTQITEWKTMARTTTASVPSPGASPSVKNFSHLQGSRPQQPGLLGTEISFGGNKKPSPTTQQQHPVSVPSSTSNVGSTSLKSAIGGTLTTYTDGKASSILGPAPTAASSSQPAKNVSSGTSRKSSSGSSRNVPSISGNSHITSAQTPTTRPSQQQNHQNQLPQQSRHHQFQQAQLFFSNSYMQGQSPQTASTNSIWSGYYQRRPSEQQTLPSQQQQNSSAAPSGLMPHCSSSFKLTTGITSDPAKAVAGASTTATGTSHNLKGFSPSARLSDAAQIAAQTTGGAQPVSVSYPYIHTISALPRDPSDQKPAAGTTPFSPSLCSSNGSSEKNPS